MWGWGPTEKIERLVLSGEMSEAGSTGEETADAERREPKGNS